MDKIVIGIDIGGTKIAFGAFGQDQRLLAKHTCKTEQSLGAHALTAHIAGEIDALCRANHLDPRSIGGIGIGAPSWVDYQKGRVIFTPNIPCLADFPLRDALYAYYPVPIAVDNDANLAALAEYKEGAGRGFSDMLYTTVSTGVGGGFILDGSLYHGAYGCAGQIGHMLATPGTGELCGCGKSGCFESYASGAHIHQHVLARLQKGEKTVMTDLVSDPREISGEVLHRAFTAHDRMAEEILGQMAGYLGILFYNVYQALNINCFVVGGGLMTGFGEALLSRIKAAFFDLHSTSPLPLEVTIKQAELQQDYGIIGACLLLNEV